MGTLELHGGDLLDGGWWACHHPERPADEDVNYDARCRACILAARASLAVDGDCTGDAFDHDRYAPDIWSLARWVEAAEAEHHDGR